MAVVSGLKSECASSNLVGGTMKKYKHKASPFINGDIVIYKGNEYTYGYECKLDRYVVIYDHTNTKNNKVVPTDHIVLASDLIKK